MIPTALILFREVLEIAIIISVILAATRGVADRGRWVLYGILGGVAGSAVIAYFAGELSEAMEGMGQEVFYGTILSFAVLMIGWTVIWMKKHGQELAAKLKGVGESVKSGELPLLAITLVVAISMLREGAEIVLFMHGILATTKESMLAIITGGMAGATAASIIGVMLYFGIIRISIGHVFKVTGGLLTLVACGLASASAGYFIQADMIPALYAPLWDSSGLLEENSMLGIVLHSLIGYAERPSAMQLIWYVVTGGAILLFTWTTRTGLFPLWLMKPAVTAAAMVTFLAATSLSISDAEASRMVYSPRVEEGMIEMEYRGQYDIDERASEDAFQKHKFAIGYGFTNWWAAELYAVVEREATGNWIYDETEWENRFQFTEQGEYFVDVGALVEYVHKTENRADKIEAFLLLEKQIARTVHTANLGFEQEVDSNATGGPEPVAALRSMYLLNPHYNPGIEYYGEFNKIGNHGTLSEQHHRAGPALYGDIAPGWSYEIGWLFGLTQATEDHSLKFILEYEFPL